jgi:hypothetical protein
VNTQRAIVISIVLGLAPPLVGCGKSKGLERLPVHGTVTFASGERPDCSITFTPANGQPGPSANTMVVGGSYKFDRGKGPTAGPHTVTVTRIIHRSDELKAIAEKKPVAPKKANWTESVDVLDNGKYVQDFDLKDD